jgi:hypothetical protein
VDRSEAQAQRYLQAQGFRDIVYEPNGTATMPDFLVDGGIAVEVRRLNQHEVVDGRPRGLETVTATLDSVLADVFDALGSPGAGPSWFVVCEYRRPLPPWRELKRALLLSLQGVSESCSEPPAKLRVASNFDVTLIRATDPHTRRFLPGALLDHDSGGCVLAEMRRNLEICLSEKTRKAEAVQVPYREWWFILVDYIGRGITEEECQQLGPLVSVERPWDRVILVDPLNAERWTEL